MAARNKTTFEFAGRNTLRSSAHVQAIQDLCEQEFLIRAKAAWTIIRSVIDNEGWTPSEDNHAQIRSIIEDALTTGSTDIGQVYGEACGMTAGNWPTLERGLAHALDTAMADVEIDLLGRRVRRLPLEDELSPPRYLAAREHWRKANSLAAQDTPDTTNAVKEAASAVESMAQVVRSRKTRRFLG